MINMVGGKIMQSCMYIRVCHENKTKQNKIMATPNFGVYIQEKYVFKFLKINLLTGEGPQGVLETNEKWLITHLSLHFC